jgi:hypothetical protein
MLHRKLRLSACVLALGALLGAPSLARADISIVVNEVDSSGAFVQNLGSFNSPVGQSFFTIGSSVGTPGAGITNSGLFDISNLNSTLTSNGTFGSLTTSFTLTIDKSYNQSVGDGLQFVITATGAQNSFPGQPGSFTNNAGASSAIAGSGGQDNIAGENQVTASTTVQGVTTPSSVDRRGDGSVSFPPAQTTNGTVSNLPNPYSITQTITVLAVPVNSSALIAQGATFGGDASSTVTANSSPVPAPPALALALIALPILGMQRAFRRKAA